MAKTKILVVDDDDLLLEIIASAFSDQYYDVYLLKDPRLFMTRVVEVLPDVIFLDMHMPLINGDALVGQLKSSKYKNIPIIFITADTSTELHKAMFAMGGCTVLTKPFSLPDLISQTRPVVELTRLKKLTQRLSDC